MEQALTLRTGDVITWVLALCGGIVTLAAAIGAISKMFTPYRALKKQAERNAELLAKDNKRIADCETSNTHVCRALLALLDHELTGNSVDRLRTAKDDLQRYLTEK